MIRTVLQIIIFVDACAVAILCFLQANKGQSVLKGITDTGSSLFSANKEVGADKVITKIISISSNSTGRNPRKREVRFTEEYTFPIK